MQTATLPRTKHKFGQYFTPKIVADFMIELADIAKSATILEPSCGEGVFLSLLQDKGFSNLTAYEIDEDLAQSFSNVKYESFVSAKINETYDLIIGRGVIHHALDESTGIQAVSLIDRQRASWMTPLR